LCDSTPKWDFNLSTACVITLDGFQLTNAGSFDVGSSVTGAATFDNNGIVNMMNASANLDGSTFKNPAGAHLLSLVA